MGRRVVRALASAVVVVLVAAGTLTPADPALAVNPAAAGPAVRALVPATVTAPAARVTVGAIGNRTVASSAAKVAIAPNYTATATARVTSAKITVKKRVGKKYKTVAKAKKSYAAGVGTFRVYQTIRYQKAKKVTVDQTTGAVTVSAWGKKKHATKKTSTVTVSVLRSTLPGLRAATYNVRNATLDIGGEHAWTNRRAAVAATILGQAVDVVGLQEAEYTPITVNGVTLSQYQDLLGLLGGSYRITTGLSVADGCGEALGADPDANEAACDSYSAGIRIVYNASTLTLIDRGQADLSDPDNPRYAVWAIFAQNSTGHRFVFVNTHLTTGVTTSANSCATDPKYATRKAQAAQVVATIGAVAGGLPVVLVGDMNSNKFSCPDNGPYHVYSGAGLVDPLDNTDRLKSAGHPTAAAQIHTRYDSSNHFDAAPRSHPWPLGTNVDYIWVSAGISTLEYETVVRLDSASKFVTPIPSDHNMIRATLQIPG